AFFFSSRRRHTRCYRDWSSDVCSSDLLPAIDPATPGRWHGRRDDVLQRIALVPPRGGRDDGDADRGTAHHVERPVHAQDHSRERSEERRVGKGGGGWGDAGIEGSKEST